MHQPANVSEPESGIAIVGMSCILPGGIDSIEALWKFLCDGGDAIAEVPADRWNNKAVYDPDPGVPERRRPDGEDLSQTSGFSTQVSSEFLPAKQA